MESPSNLRTAFLTGVLMIAPSCAHDPVVPVERARASRETKGDPLGLKVPGKVEAATVYSQGQDLVVTLIFSQLRTRGQPLPETEVWLLKSDGTAFPHSEKPKRIDSADNGYSQPTLTYIFPSIEKSRTVALVTKVDGEFFVEKLGLGRIDGTLFAGVSAKSDTKYLDGRAAWIEILPTKGNEMLSHQIFLIVEAPDPVIQTYKLKALTRDGVNIPLKMEASATIQYRRFEAYRINEKSEIATVIVEWDKKSETFNLLPVQVENPSK